VKYFRFTVVLLVVMTVLQVAAVTGARAATDGTLLMDESFTGSSVSDPNLLPLGAACLTGASAAPPSGASALGVCSSSAGAPAVGQVPGYLQLTDARTSQAGGVVYNQAIPAEAGLAAQFDMYQYGGSGADGISFFLTDGSRDLTATGVYGQALGYAGGTDLPGVNGGYLGIGFDVFGNYSTNVFGLGQNCTDLPPTTGRVPNSVALRGPGQDQTGYCWIAGTVGSNSTSTLPGQMHASDLASAMRKVRVTVSPGSYPTVTVDIDFNDGNGFQQVLQHTMTEQAPATYKFGWAASTGIATDVHLIRSVEIRTINPLDGIHLVKQVDRTSPQPARYSAGDTVPYQYIVTNSNSRTLTGVTVTDANASGITCPATTLPPAGQPGSSMTCTGTHTLTTADISPDGTFTNTATASGLNQSGSTITSNQSSVTIEVDGKRPTPTPPQPTPTPPQPVPTPIPPRPIPKKPVISTGFGGLATKVAKHHPG
jgi:uncharacterized repeat protein (TIGR01451 family)